MIGERNQMGEGEVEHGTLSQHFGGLESGD